MMVLHGRSLPARARARSYPRSTDELGPWHPSGGVAAKRHAPPSRKNRKSITTWQDEVVVKELRDISHDRGIPQKVLIAEGLSYVLANYRRRSCMNEYIEEITPFESSASVPQS
jgi:hypothetical protein